MKKILLLIILVLTVSVSGFSEDRIFKKYPGNMEISTFYVSPTALKLGMSVNNSEQLKSFKKLIKKPESIEILSTWRTDSQKTLGDDCKEVAERLNMELLVNSSNMDTIEKTNIYIGKILNDSEIQDIMIETMNTGKYTIVLIRGIINSHELINLYNSNSK